VASFPGLVERVLEDVRRDMEGVKAGIGKGNGVGSGSVNGAGTQQQQQQQALVVAGSSSSLAVPQGVVDEGVRVTRECLELVCEMEE